MENASAKALALSDIFLDPVTDDVKSWFQLINYVIICGSVSLFGIVANVVNILVFVLQGFKDSINISLLGLAVSDLACSITMLWTSICHNLVFQNREVLFELLDVMYLTGGYPHECFNRITSFITAFITLERCLCIAMPLKVKSIITPFKTKVINVSIFVSMLLLFSPFYFVNTFEWKYNLYRNCSILVLSYTQEREIVETITFFIHSVFLSSVLLICVAICTVILVVKLNKKSKWRKEAFTQTNLTSEMSTSVRDKKVVKMITLISIIYVACYIPATVNFLVMVLYPDYSYAGRLHNLLFVSYSAAFVLEAINSSVNIFVYFNMSTKFKDTLNKLLLSKEFIT